MPTAFKTVLITTALLVLAGCSPALPGQKAANGSKSDPRAMAVRFSQCMREHGITDFPDPSSDGNIQIQADPGYHPDMDPDSAAWQAAQQACSKYMPGGGPGTGKPDPQQQQKALRFAQCMREHGITDFPDPGSGGGISIQAGQSSDLDPNSPQFQAAQRACQSILGASGGMVTSGGPQSGGR
ncbi:MAG TPA: hypothetical protein VF134_08305 [Candidatus Dormibacteraeota bacterium]